MIKYDWGYISVPVKRQFSWKAFWLLGLLYILGNLAAIPLLQQRQMLIESPATLALLTFIAFILNGISLCLADKTGLGVPFLEGNFKKGEVSYYFRKMCAISLLISIVVSLLLIIDNVLIGEIARSKANFPPFWMSLLSSVTAGIKEELFYRFFLMTLFVWVGGFFKKNSDGRPAQVIYWIAVLISGVIFGWAHIDDKLNWGGSSAMLLNIFMMSCIPGIILGWLYWKYGLESAIFTHFLIDALRVGIMIPAMHTENVILCVIIILCLIIVSVISWRMLFGVHKSSILKNSADS
ncbi:MAG: CPBP family intramembrane metalloprotease [Planctomycetes bacterium]|nr:CPBP family intramembrane metalloprotease [Planctomycetota bacterium]